MQHPDIQEFDSAQADAAIAAPGAASSRYFYDSFLSEDKGWQQYDTRDDASYFGVWVHVARREVFTYAEGDRSFQKCDTDEAFRALLQHMAELYGSAPPFMVVYDDNGRTNCYANRPGDELLQGEVALQAA